MFIIDIPLIIGTNNAANIVVANPTTGANLNTQEVVVLITNSFFISLKKSHNGCKMQTPFLPAKNAFVFLITPINKNGAIKRTNIFINNMIKFISLILQTKQDIQ